MRDHIRSEFLQNKDMSSLGACLKQRLKIVMIRAKRAGYWYSLNKIERSLYSLCLNLNVKFRSLQLARAVISVLKRLSSAGTTLLSIIDKGREIAWLYSNAAVSWGNKNARSWRNEMSYIVYLGRFFCASPLST
jgi:hypothetical protein